MIGVGPELSDQKVFFDVGNAWNQPITPADIKIPLPDKCSLVFLHLEGERELPVAPVFGFDSSLSSATR